MNENRKTAAVAPYSELANEFEALKSSLTPCGAAAFDWYSWKLIESRRFAK